MKDAAKRKRERTDKARGKNRIYEEMNVKEKEKSGNLGRKCWLTNSIE